MTRDELVELGAKAAWNESQDCEPGENWDSLSKTMRTIMRTYISDSLDAMAAKGLAVVPLEATAEMVNAGGVGVWDSSPADFHDLSRSACRSAAIPCYQAMVAEGNLLKGK